MVAGDCRKSMKTETSSRIETEEILAPRIPAAHLRKFLLDLANMRDDIEAVRRLLAMHQDIMPLPRHLYRTFLTHSEHSPAAKLRLIDGTVLRSWFKPLRNW